HDDDRGRTVGELRRVPRGDRAIGVERRLQLRERLRGAVGADALVSVDRDRITLALGNLDGDDLLGELSLVPCFGGPLMTSGSPCILLLTGDPDLPVDLIGGLPHLLAGERRPQAVVDHRVDELGVSEARALSGAREKVRRAAQRLPTAGDDDGGDRHGASLRPGYGATVTLSQLALTTSLASAVTSSVPGPQPSRSAEASELERVSSPVPPRSRAGAPEMVNVSSPGPPDSD